ASLLDGVSGDRGFRGGARGEGGLRSQSSFSQGSVRAFRVSPHSYSAQYGGGAGGLLTAASRSGGDALHGGGFYTVRESAWAAANPFSVVTHYKDGVIVNSLVKPRDSLQSVGGRIGGPVGGRRVFGFASIDEQFRGFPAVSSPSLATFYALSATQVALLGNRGVTAAATRAALNYLDSLTGEVPRSANRGLEFVRFDVRASARDNVTASYSHSRLDSPAGSGRGASAAVVARGTASLGDSTVRGDAATVRWLHTFSPKLNNEVRGQFATDLEFEQPRAPLAQEPGIGPGGFAPQVSIQGEFLYGTPASLGRNAYPDEQRVQAADVLQWAPGHHLFTMGADWSRVHDRIDSLADTDGSFRYDSGATAGRAGGLVDWITDFTFNVRANPNGGCPSINATNHFFCFRSFTQSFGQQQVEFTTHDFAGFAQDLWRLRAGLTVEMGARYEYTLLPLPQQPNVALDAAFRATGATSVFPEDRNNAGPRVAVAWSPRQGRWGTARVGYGVYFGRLPGSRVRAALLDTALPSSATRIHITPTTVTACPQVANQGFGYPCAYVSAPPAAVAATTSADLFAHNFRLPAVQQAELTLEREFGAGLSVRGTYSMAIATQLPNTVDVNIAPAAGLGRFVLQGGDGHVRDGETFVVPLYSGRVASQFGPVTVLESNANATWHGVTVEARLRRRSGLEFHGSYTWSKAIDYGAEQGVTPRRNGQFDPFSVGYDKGLADANFPQRFAGDAIWRSSLRRGPDALRKALTGWRASALGTAGSGRPYSYEIFGGTRLSGGSFSINGSGGSAWLPTVGRNTLRLPARWNTDARLGRGFRLTDRLHGEGYVEAFNVANHVNAARVNARAFLAGTPVNGVTPLVFQNAATVAAEGLNTQAFGTVTSSTSGVAHERQLQLGVRLEF
ncbi:MAG: TonB-dependent receptor, partial [Acidobacteriaceae bacterium]